MTSPSSSTDRGKVVWYVGAALVAVIALIAVLIGVTGGDDDPTPVAEETGEVESGGPSGSDGSSESSTSAGSGGESTTTEGDSPSTTEAEASPSDEGEPLPEFTGTDDDPAVGMTIPTFSGSTLTDEPITIGADGTAKVIVFLAHWCPHCQAEVPRIVDHLADNPMPDDVDLVGVSTAVVPERGNYPPSEWLEREGWTVPTLADSEEGTVAQAYGLSSFPYFVVADADGKVVTRASGELTTDEFDDLVTAAQTGEAP